MLKQLRQVAGVRQVTVVDFKQGLFALTPSQGGQISEASIGSAVRRSGFTLARVVPPSRPKPTQPTAPMGNTVLTDAVDKQLAAARGAFHKSDSEGTAEMANSLAKKIPSLLKDPKKVSREDVSPRDADALQFLALVSFSQQNYDDAANRSRLALLGGLPWDWNRLSRHYVKPDLYHSQLRRLEQSIRAESSPSKRFLIAYHYWMMGHHESARKQFEKAAVGQPEDKLIPELLQRLNQLLDQSSKKVSGP